MLVVIRYRRIALPAIGPIRVLFPSALVPKTREMNTKGTTIILRLATNIFPITSKSPSMTKLSKISTRGISTKLESLSVLKVTPIPVFQASSR